MVNINGIYTFRKYETWPSWHVVFEWEDELAKDFAVQLKYGGVIRRCCNRVLRRLIHVIPFLKQSFVCTLFRSDSAKPYKLCYVMNSESMWSCPRNNILPIILDSPLKSTEYVLKCTEKLPVFWVTNYDFWKELKRINPNSTARYIPLSVSDIYYSENVPEKTIDVIQFGRANEKLHEWMLQFCKKHPDVEYVYQTAGGTLTYESTTRGNLGKFDTRKEYFDLLRKSKISLVSSPCIDGGRIDDFGNVDFFTPRFYESAANYCYMIGRYTENEEAVILNIGSVCDNVKSQEEFEQFITIYLSSNEFLKTNQYKEFLKENLTSVRAVEMIKILENV